MRSIARRLSESLSAFREVFRNPALRRIQLAWAGSMIGSWSYGIALSVYAYAQDGPYAVGLIGMIRWIVAAAAAPVAGALGDRFSRARVMLASDLLRASAILVMAVVAGTGGPSLAVYAISVAVTVASTAFRPAQAALLPSLARTPQELTASNVTSSTIESVGIFVGPALGGLVLAATSISWVFVVTGALFLWSAALVSRLPRVARPAREEAGAGRGHLAELAEGARTLVANRGLALLVGLFVTQTFVDGLLGVLVVVTALDLLGMGASGVGFLNSAAGVGGIVGAVVAAALLTRGKLATDFGFGITLWGLPIVLVALWPSTTLALVALALVGIGNTIVDVAGDTLLQRSVPDEVLGRVFGLMEALMLVGVAAGAGLAPFLADTLSTRGALAVTGSLLPVLALLSWRGLRAIDAAAVPVREVALLRSIPFFAPLPEGTVEQLAGRLERRRVDAGDVVVRQGDPGDRFYVVESGTLAVEVDGAPRPPVEPGGFFGEIALLRDVPRTATVRAVQHAELLSLGRDEFVAAVTGHPESADEAGLVVAGRLGAPHTGLALG